MTHGGTSVPGLGSWPARRARINPARAALVQGERRVTYGELADRVQALAGALLSKGVQPGDRIAYLGANDIATFETFFAAAWVEAVFVPLNIRLAPPEISALLTDCGARVLVHAPDVDALLAGVGVLPAVTTVLALQPASSPFDADDYEDAVQAGLAGPRPPERLADADAPVLLLYTSGTTGTPKGALLSHANLTWNTVNQLAHVDIVSTDLVLSIAPLFHIAGIGQVVLPALFKGATLVVQPRFDAEAVLETIGRLRITGLFAVPTMLQMINECPRWVDADLASLRYVLYGGSPIADRVAQAWLARGSTLVQGYGMTEAAPGVLMAVPGGVAAHPVSPGVAHMFVDVALLDGAADGRDPVVPAVPGATGELLVRGPNVFRGYLGRPDDTAAAFVDGWYRTGDVVTVGADGWFQIVDRVKNMIISGGENIYPAEIEAALGKLPGVREAAVVGVPDARWGEVGLALLVVDDDVPWDADRLRVAAEPLLARYKIPKYVQVVQQLPRNATGKLVRSGLPRESTALAADANPPMQEVPSP